MSLPVTITDGRGSGNAAKVSPEGVLEAVIHPHPPVGDATNVVPVRREFKNVAGSADMKVAASLAAPSDYFIEAAASDGDVYVKVCSVLIADAGATLNDFGNISALTNGVQLIWKTEEQGEEVLADSLQSNFDFVRLANGQPAFGTGNSAFRANNVVSTSEAFIPAIDFAQTFGNQWGLRLRAGTTDRVIFRVRDDTTGVDAFGIVATGVRLPPE